MIGGLLLYYLFRFLDAQHQACFLRCKDNYMNGMQHTLAEGTSELGIDMISPLQAILSQGINHAQIFIHLDGACRLNAAYQRCLAQCPDNPAKNILQSGQKSWNIICYDFRNDTEFRDVVLPCWSKMGFKLSRQCSTIAQLLQAEILHLMEWGLENVHERMDGLCISVYAYDKCLVDKNYEICGSKAGEFVVKLTYRTSQTLIELLTNVLGMVDLPQGCKEWSTLKDIIAPSPKVTARKMRNNRMTLLKNFAVVLIAILITA